MATRSPKRVERFDPDQRAIVEAWGMTLGDGWGQESIDVPPAKPPDKPFPGFHLQVFGAMPLWILGYPPPPINVYSYRITVPGCSGRAVLRHLPPPVKWQAAIEGASPDDSAESIAQLWRALGQIWTRHKGGRPLGQNPDPDPKFPRRYLAALRAIFYDDDHSELPTKLEVAEQMGISKDTLDRRLETYADKVKWPPMWPPSRKPTP